VHTEYGIKAQEGMVNYNESVNSAKINFQNQQEEEAARYQAELAKYMKSTYGNTSGSTSSSTGGGVSWVDRSGTPSTSPKYKSEFGNPSIYANEK
jgi:hypothetical protein